MYRNAEPRSLRDLFFHFKRERKLRSILLNKHENLKFNLSGTLDKEETESDSSNNNKINNSYENLNLSNDEDLSSPKFRPFIRSCLLLLVSRMFRVGILFPVIFFFT